MRTAIVCTAVAAFFALGVLDVVGGDFRTGIASMCLAAANGLLLLNG